MTLLIWNLEDMLKCMKVIILWTIQEMARFIKIGRRIKWTQDIPIEAQWDLMLHAAAAQNVNSLNNAAESMTEIEVM